MPNRNYKGNSHSENGWPIVDTEEIITTHIPGVNNVKIELRKGDVTTVLVAWLIWFHYNVERIDVYQPRDEWGFSWDNLVSNSNHLSGTAVDVNATQYPWKRYTMKEWMVNKIDEGLRLFEGQIFWGRNWQTVDEMHFQIAEYNPKRLAEFAQKLRDGYLGIYKPADPNGFPLPRGYFYGPLDGIIEGMDPQPDPNLVISGEYIDDLPAWKEGLKRWQTALGLPATGIYDEQTKRACKVIQKSKGWPQLGHLDVGEWDAVIKNNFEVPKDFPPAPPSAERAGVYWADVSQWQPALDQKYPHKVLSIRSNSGDKTDEKFRQNYRTALEMISEGRLEFLIVYYFFRPGQANCDLWKQLVTIDGVIPPKVVCMVDVEGDGGKISGNVSEEVNDEIRRLQTWLGDPRRVIGYYNQKADPYLWPNRPKGLRMVVPWYNNDISRSPSMEGLIAHQYSDRVSTPPFGPCDANYANITLTQFREALGLGHSPVPQPIPEVPKPQPKPVPKPMLIPPTLVGVITGPGTTTEKFDFRSTDLGICRKTPDGRILTVFGDTFRGVGVGNGEWMSPVAVYSPLGQHRDGLKFNDSFGGPRAKQMLPYQHNQGFSTVLPTDVLEIDGRLYMWVMVCQGLGNVLWTEIQCSDDSGKTWFHSGVKLPGEFLQKHMQMITWDYDPSDGYVYIWSTGFQRDKGIILHRVPKDKVLAPGAYEPWGWDGQAWRWGVKPSIIMEGRYGELNARFINGELLFCYFDAGKYDVAVKSLIKATDNMYTAPRTQVARGSSWAQNNLDRGFAAQLYGGYIVPGSDHSELHVVISQWNTSRNWPYQSMQYKLSVPRVR